MRYLELRSSVDEIYKKALSRRHMIRGQSKRCLTQVYALAQEVEKWTKHIAIFLLVLIMQEPMCKCIDPGKIAYEFIHAHGLLMID